MIPVCGGDRYQSGSQPAARSWFDKLTMSGPTARQPNVLAGQLPADQCMSGPTASRLMIERPCRAERNTFRLALRLVIYNISIDDDTTDLDTP